eukprot:656086-Pelagomonas_calceolata.AAC.9
MQAKTESSCKPACLPEPRQCGYLVSHAIEKQRQEAHASKARTFMQAINLCYLLVSTLAVQLLAKQFQIEQMKLEIKG